MAAKYSFTILLAMLISAITQYLVIKISHKKGIFIDDHDSGQPQKFHSVPTPRIGGIGLFLACVLMALHGKLGILLLCSGLPAFFAGVFEDLRGDLSPKLRLGIMLLSGVLAILLCDAVVTDYGLFKTPYFIGVVISFIAIVGLINGTNMIDGYNGLLGFTSLIIFLSFALVSYSLKDDMLTTITVIIAASIAGFLLFNFPSGKIFMGDGGAYFIGFIMAVVSMLLSKRHLGELSPFFILVCLAYPVFEVIFSFTRKGLVEKVSPMKPDRWHMHMLVSRVVCQGKNVHTTLVIAPIILAFNAAAVIYKEHTLVLIGLAALFVLVYLFSYNALRKRDVSEA